MCRHLAYLGPPVSLESLLFEPEHSLVHQAYAAREMRSGSLNADGFGVGWYSPAVRPEPARYRRAGPMWADRSLASLAGVVSSGAVVAAVRNATPGLPIEDSGAAPFVAQQWLFSLNGFVRDFRGDAGMELRASLSPTRLAGIEGATDSEVLFAAALDHLDAGATAGEALRSVVTTVEKLSGGWLNLLLCDGEQVAATTVGNTLYTLVSGESTVIASEPLDGREWQPVADRSLVSATAGLVAVDNLEAPA